MYTLIGALRLPKIVKAVLFLAVTAALVYISVKFLYPAIQAQFFDGAVI